MKEATIFLGLIILTTMTTTVESGLQNVQLFLITFLCCFWGVLQIRNQNNLATLPGFASVLINGYTYSYVKKDPRNGEKCCRPIKSKCEETIVQNSEKMPTKRRDTCKVTRGEILCGKRCTAIIKALEKLQRKVEKDEKSREKEEKEITKEEEKLKDLEKEQEKEIIVEEKENKDYIKERTEAPKRKPESGPITSNVNRRVTDVPHSSEEHHSEEEDSFEHYSIEDTEETSSEAKHPKADPEGGAKGLKVKKGQKLTQKQLQRLENAAEEKETESKNPLCKVTEMENGKFQ